MSRTPDIGLQELKERASIVAAEEARVKAEDERLANAKDDSTRQQVERQRAERAATRQAQVSCSPKCL